ncbi:MAG: glycosyltransferase family 4 protein [Chloroflexi bacterium]|nr:glycosyltransferase family 4 protein [Chloroflexota bacterium]
MICPEIGDHGGSGFIGGGAVSALRLSAGLAKKGHEITIITTPHRYPGKAAGSLDWAEVRCLPVAGDYLSLRYGLSFIWKAMAEVRQRRDRKFDIIHVHSGYSSMSTLTWVLKKITGVPAVHSLYCPLRSKSPGKARAVDFLPASLLSERCLKRVDRIVAISRNVADSLIKAKIPLTKISVVPPAIDLDIYNPQAKSDVRQKLGIASGQPVILFVGNLNKRKGIHILLESLASVVKKTPEVRLLMVLNIPIEKYESEDLSGARDEMGLMHKVKNDIKALGLVENVVPLGIMPDLAGVMAASDMLVIPMLETTGIADYPISTLEAMACGKPVIATRVSGLPEIVRDRKNGLLIDPDNPQALADALQYLLEHTPEAQKMGMEGARLISRDFSTEVVVDKMEQVYRELMSVNNGRSSS